MGKALVKSHNGNGHYTVEIQYDRTGIDAQIADLSTLISKLDEVISNPESTEIQILFAKANKLSAQKRIDYLQSASVPENEEVSAWCADLTDNLSGEVGTIEIGRERSLGVNIQPGFEGNAAYSGPRDGILAPTMGLPSVMSFINLGFLPGGQKWRPMYRYGRITAINVETDTCEIELEDTKSSQQELSINQTPILSAVPISYMDCNSAAFSVGDDVLVKFQDFDWNQPQVIGFKANPQPCELVGIVIVSSPSGDEAFAWDAISNSLHIEKDTLANVIDQIGTGTQVQALPTGELSREEFPWDWVAPRGGSLSLITPVPGYEAEPRVIQHPENTLRLLEIQALAFGSNGDPDLNQDFNDIRLKWEHGDTITLRTIAGSPSVMIIDMDTTDGAFDENYCSTDPSVNVTQTWTITVYAPPYNPYIRYIHVEGDTLGPIVDLQYMTLSRSCYPLTPNEVQGIGDANWLYRIGFNYGVDRGNYTLKNGSYLAPVIFHWIASGSSAVPYIHDQFEAITGIPAGENEEVHPRAQLFYFPCFSWPWDVGIGPYLPVLEREELKIPKIFDSWADSAGNSISRDPITDGKLNVTTGVADKTKCSLIYDAFNLSVGTGDHYGLHCFCKVEHSEILSPIEQEIWSGINAERANVGESPLTVQLNLQWAAERHAQDMAANYEEYIELIGQLGPEHIGSDGSTAYERAEQEGYFDFHSYHVGDNIGHQENVAYNTDEGVIGSDFVTGWMNSPPHKEALLTPRYRDTGIACVVAEDGTTFACQVFGLCKPRLPGFSPLPAAGITKYMMNNFIWSGTGNESKVPKVYLA